MRKEKVTVEESVPAAYATAQRELITSFEEFLGRWGWIVLWAGVASLILSIGLIPQVVIGPLGLLYFFIATLGFCLLGAGIALFTARHELHVWREKFEKDHEEVER